MKYETLIENYHGHCFRNRFEAKSDEDAKQIAIENGYKYFASDDCLWRVNGDYVNYSHYDETQQELFNKNYIKI